MKKTIISLVLTLFVVMFLSSCTGGAGPTGALGLSSMIFQDGVFPSNAYSGTTDAGINSGAYADNNYGTDDIASVGSWGGSTMRPFIKFDLSGVIPSNVTIVNAYLTITTFSTAALTMNMYSLLSPWNETQCTWNDKSTASAWTAPAGGGDIGTLLGSKAADSTVLTFSISPALVTSWITSPSTNYGVLLKATDEASGIWVNVYNREYTVATSRPRLTIYYSLP